MKKKLKITEDDKQKRIDTVLVEKALVASRNKAREMIERGMVLINDTVVKKPSDTVTCTDKVTLLHHLPFVGRGGEKIESGFSKWNIQLEGKVVLDVGASTGGFTDAAVIRGARKVYAIDVGHDQLDKKLRDNPKVISMESTDIRNVLTLPDLTDLALVDVSFISLTLVLPIVFKLLKTDGELITLVKPQFEVGYGKTKKGIVKDDLVQKDTLQKIKDFAQLVGFTYIDSVDSPIEGKHGNKEFLMYFKKARS